MPGGAGYLPSTVCIYILYISCMLVYIYSISVYIYIYIYFNIFIIRYVSCIWVYTTPSVYE